MSGVGCKGMEGDLSNDERWVQGLTNNRAGRLIGCHLACMEKYRTDDGQAGAATEALGNELVFIHALSRSIRQSRPLPCGISTPFPRYIAILNLSGDRNLVYSNNPALLRCMCTSSTCLGKKDLERAVSAFETYPTTSTGTSARFVLLTYSIPWQSGTDAAFWHLSACEMKMGAESTETNLQDRILHFSSVSTVPFNGKSVMDASNLNVLVNKSLNRSIPIIGDKQIEDFTESYSSACLDFAATPEIKMDGKNASMLSLMHALTKDRARDQMELKQLQAQAKDVEIVVANIVKQCEERENVMVAQHKKEQEAHRAKAQDMLRESRKQNDDLSEEILNLGQFQKKILSEQSKSNKAHEKSLSKQQELERQSAAKDRLHNATLSNHLAKISKLECAVAANDERLKNSKSDMQKNHAATTEDLVRAHQSALERLESSLESKKRIINQLSDNNERVNVQLSSFQTHKVEQAKRIKDLEIELKKAQIALEQSKVRSRTCGTNTGKKRNSSTATHHCASTQTKPVCKVQETVAQESQPPPPPPMVAEEVVQSKEPVVVQPPLSTVGGNIVSLQPQAFPTCYQAAIDMLQDLVVAHGDGEVSQQINNRHHTNDVYQMPMPMPMPMPLPYPHFMPNAPAHQHPMQNGQRNGRGGFYQQQHNYGRPPGY